MFIKTSAIVLLVFCNIIFCMDQKIVCDKDFIKKINSDKDSTISQLGYAAGNYKWSDLNQTQEKKSLDDIIAASISLFFKELTNATAMVTNKKDLCFLFDKCAAGSTGQTLLSACFMFLNGVFPFYQSNKKITDSFIEHVNNFFNCIEDENDRKNAKIYTMFCFMLQQRTSSSLYTFYDPTKEQAFIYFHSDFYDNLDCDDIKRKNPTFTFEYYPLYATELTKESFPFQCKDNYELVTGKKVRELNIDKNSFGKNVSSLNQYLNICFNIQKSALLFYFGHCYTYKKLLWDKIEDNNSTAPNIQYIDTYTISTEEYKNILESHNSKKQKIDTKPVPSATHISLNNVDNKRLEEPNPDIQKIKTESIIFTDELAAANLKYNKELECLKDANKKLTEQNNRFQEIIKIKKEKINNKKTELKELQNANQRLSTSWQRSFIIFGLLIACIVYQQYQIYTLKQYRIV